MDMSVYERIAHHMKPELEPIYEPGDEHCFMYEEINGVKVGKIAVGEPTEQQINEDQ